MGCSRLRLIKNTLKSVGIFSMLDVHQKKYLIAGIDLSPDQNNLVVHGYFQRNCLRPPRRGTRSEAIT
jgi:hypothetical protein